MINLTLSQCIKIKKYSYVYITNWDIVEGKNKFYRNEVLILKSEINNNKIGKFTKVIPTISVEDVIDYVLPETVGEYTLSISTKSISYCAFTENDDALLLIRFEEGSLLKNIEMILTYLIHYKIELGVINN